MEPRISIVTLGVRDLAAATAFYRDGLRWPLLADKSSPGISFFEVNGGSLWLALYGVEALADDAGVSAQSTGFARFSLAHNLRSRAEVDALYADAVRAGAKPVKSPQEVFWGGYSGYFADPDGFLWEVAHNPFVWIG